LAKKKPKSFRPSPVEKWAFSLLAVLILVSLCLMIAYAVGCNIRGIEVFSYILTGSSTFLMGVLVGENRRR